MCPGRELLRLDMRVKSKPVWKMFFCNRITCYFYISSCNRKRPVACFAFKQCICNISCHCDSRDIGRTSQRLQNRIRQHVLKFIKTDQIPNFRNASPYCNKSSTPAMFSEPEMVNTF